MTSKSTKEKSCGIFPLSDFVYSGIPGNPRLRLLQLAGAIEEMIQREMDLLSKIRSMCNKKRLWNGMEPLICRSCDRVARDLEASGHFLSMEPARSSNEAHVCRRSLARPLESR